MIIKGDSFSLPLADNSIDSVCCDPPYGLEFMGKDWDKAVPSVAIWAEVLRVLKPGAFAAVLCTPRQDCQAEMVKRLAAAGFNVGFSSITWTYATGFPKAANLSKLADKRAGAVREVVGMSPYFCSGRNVDNMSAGGVGATEQRDRSITAPSTTEAKALEGAYAGFQPKPAFEPVLIVMKPLSEKTYLDQALTNGKGCTWLDDGRIPTGTADVEEQRGRSGGGRSKTFGNIGRDAGDRFDPPAGRFPANVLCSDDVLNDLVERKSGKMAAGTLRASRQGYSGHMPHRTANDTHGDSGSYSRYFDLDVWFADRIAQLPEEVRRVFPWLIVPKPSKREKNAGLTGRESVTVGDGRQKSIDNPFQRGETERVNSHVSVKPVKLMSYLITIFSRVGDVVLDPFAGSGSTGVAAAIMGRHFAGVELDAEYTQIAIARTMHALKHDGSTMAFELQPATLETKESDPRQTSILDILGGDSSATP